MHSCSKKVYAMWAWIFLRIFCATRILRHKTEKTFVHRLCASLVLTFRFPTRPMRHRILLYEVGTCVIYFVTCWDFPTVSVVTGLNFWPGFSGHVCSSCRVISSRNSTCQDFPTVTFLAWGNVKSLPPGTRRPGISGRNCGYWPKFTGCLQELL